jgi:hypothetical protein
MAEEFDRYEAESVLKTMAELFPDSSKKPYQPLFKDIRLKSTMDNIQSGARKLQKINKKKVKASVGNYSETNDRNEALFETGEPNKQNPEKYKVTAYNPVNKNRFAPKNL